MANHGSYYTAPLYMGTKKLEMQVDFDTGSSWLTVQLTSDYCISCNSNERYDPIASQTTDADTYELKYGSADLFGYKLKDSVCVTEDHCVDNFEFFGITK
jgi:hypothetical protein